MVVLMDTREIGRGRPRGNFILQTCRELGLKHLDIKRKIKYREEWRRVVGRQYQSKD